VEGKRLRIPKPEGKNVAAPIAPIAPVNGGDTQNETSLPVQKKMGHFVLGIDRGDRRNGRDRRKEKIIYF
jgi:hypothetical protein